MFLKLYTFENIYSKKKCFYMSILPKTSSINYTQCTYVIDARKPVISI